ncbi:hypothetical protein ACIOV9_08050 [Pseudomonas iridis]|uniref:hypothetical protein n=1 Tax=Pseudomonas iridis TaxID=2710587 RepID=UPI0038151EA1
MTISNPPPNTLQPRPSQEFIDSLVGGAMLQRANHLLSTDSAGVKAALATYGIPRFVDEFVVYSKASGLVFAPQDRAYLIYMAAQLPN